MPWRDFRDIARDRWGRDYANGQVIGNDAFHIGCLQRIADALETIADRLHPGEQERLRHKMDEDKELRERYRKMAPWWHALDDAAQALQRRLRGLFDPKVRQSTRIGRACRDVMDAERLRMTTARGDDTYTSADGDYLLHYANTVELTAIDWAGKGSARTGAFLSDYFAKQ